MVKIMKLCAASALLLAVFAMAGCGLRGGALDLKPSSLAVAPRPAGAYLSMAVDAGRIHALYTDPAATTLDLVTLPQNGGALPSTPPAVEVIDKLDVAAPLAPFFGEHLMAAQDGTVGILYRDRETDTKTVLKLAWKGDGESAWNLDVLDPAGDPLCLTPDAKGGFSAAWTSGVISRRNPAGAAGLTVPPISLSLVGRPQPTGAEGFTAYDATTSSLLDFEWNGAGYSAQPVPDGGPVHGSLRTPSGRLEIASYDPARRRLLLHEQKGSDGGFSTQTITVCDGTSQVVLLPGRGDSSLVIFDETRLGGTGRIVSQLSVLGPGSVLGGRGARYRKGVLSVGDARIEGFAAARTEDSLYVLLSQGSVRLLRIPLYP